MPDAPPRQSVGELRVLQVAARFFPDTGGIETHVYETTRRLNAMPGLRVDVLTTDRTGERPRTEIVAGTRIRRVPAWPAQRDYYLAPAVRSVIRHSHYDLIHCQGLHTAVPVIAMAAARRAGVPFIVTPHTGGHSSRVRHALRGAQWRALGPLVQDARRFICVAEFESELFARAAGVSPERVSVVPNGISLRPAAIEAVPDPATPTVVCVGRLERYKGQHHLVGALPRLLALEPETRLVLVGQGPAEQALRSQAADLGVAGRVTFTHVPSADRDAMTDLIARAHVVALLSDYEAHPIAVMEAVALQRPVVVASKAGLGELAAKGLAESVPDPADSEHVARVLARKLRAERSPSPVRDAAAPPAGPDLPTWDRCAEQLAEIYRGSA
jgi:glycosyltransferase involved in cell wall biosynthesis